MDLLQLTDEVKASSDQLALREVIAEAELRLVDARSQEEIEVLQAVTRSLRRRLLDLRKAALGSDELLRPPYRPPRWDDDDFRGGGVCMCSVPAPHDDGR